MHARRMIVAVGFLVVGAACAHRAPATSHKVASVHVVEHAFQLDVENHNWLDVTLYVQHDGQRERVGIVTAATQSRLVLPGRLIGQGGIFQLIADPVGQPGMHVSEPVSVGPQRRVLWTLESDLQRSSVASW